MKAVWLVQSISVENRIDIHSEVNLHHPDDL